MRSHIACSTHTPSARPPGTLAVSNVNRAANTVGVARSGTSKYINDQSEAS